MRPITGIKILGIRLGVIALAAYWITLFVGTHWPSGVKITREMGDKTQHFSAFFGLALLCCYVTQSRQKGSDLKRFLGIGVCLIGYAIIDELTQFFSPGRHPDVGDVVADTLGIFSAIGTYWLAKRVFDMLFNKPGEIDPTVAAEPSIPSDSA